MPQLCHEQCLYVPQGDQSEERGKKSCAAALSRQRINSGKNYYFLYAQSDRFSNENMNLWDSQIL